MKTNNLSFCGLTLLFGGALLMSRASAQPATAPSPKTIPPLTLAELEKLIGGRTTLTLNLKDATLEESAAAISASSGLKIQVRPKPVFTRPPGSPEIKLPPEPRYTFEAKGEPFWEAFLGWQRAALAAKKAEPRKPDIVLPDGRVIPHRVDTDLGLFQLRKTNDTTFLEAGNPLSEGRTLVSWPYVMVGTRLTRTQQANLDEEGLLPREEAPRTRFPLTLNGAPATPVKPAAPVAPKPPQTEEERWLDGLTLNAQTYLDPRIKPINLRCEVEEALDEKGNDLRAKGNTASVSFNNIFTLNPGDGGGVSLNISIGSQPNMGKKLVRLRGNLRFSVVTENQHWETTNLETPTDGTIWRDGTQFAVRFGGLTQTPNGWEANFSARAEGQRLRNFWENWRNEAFSGGYYVGFGGAGIFGGNSLVVQFVDEAGQVITPTSSGSGATINGSGGTKPIPVRPGDSPLPPDLTNQVYTETAKRGIWRRMNADGSVNMTRPVKMIVDLTIERREVVVPFEFTNLPLPPTAPTAK